MPEGVPVGGGLWVLVTLGWEYNDNYYYETGIEDCQAAYTTEAGARREAQRRNRQRWRELLTDPWEFEKYIEGHLIEYSTDRTDAEAFAAELAGFGITRNVQGLAQIDHPADWTDGEVDQVMALLDSITFFDVMSILLEG